jgi:alkanesulfonate monooxygenase SsuD/methylene tetrahydromethanopterin reductase-like flavin-dependent oxidoreductase (luciferase family)
MFYRFRFHEEKMGEPAMRYGLDIPTTGEYADAGLLAELAFEAEQAGWDGFFIWDVMFAEGNADVPAADPWIALAAIAMRTSRIKIGALLTPLPRRRPWQVARETATLDRLSGGRLVFGAGSGYQALDFTPFGEDYDPRIRAEKLDEGLEVLKGLWSGKPYSFQGKHYSLQQAQLLPVPLQSPRIPVWLSGGWPRRKPLQRAARWDGVYLMTVNQATNELLTPGEVREAVSYIQSLRESDEPFDIAVNGETPGDSRRGSEIVRPYEESGATWWVEYVASRETLKEYRQRIRQGPPKV